MAPPEERFVNRVVDFCDFFKQILDEATANEIDIPVSGFVMDIIKNFIKKENPGKAVQTFILKGESSFHLILERDQNYFRNHASTLFADIPEKHVKGFNSLFDVKKKDGTLLINEPVQGQLWELLESLVRNAICYVHLTRKPDPVTKKYTEAFFPSISIKKMVEMWKITSLE